VNKYFRVDSDNFIEIPFPYYQEFEKKKYKSKYQKVLFFVLNEGFVRTWKKIFSLKLEREIIKEQKIIACQFNLEGITCVGIGRQLYEDRYKKFHPKLVFKIKEGSEFNLSRLRLNEKAILKLASFLPVDECPLDEKLPQEILMQNLELEPFNVEIPDAYLWKPERIINKNNKKIFLYGFGSYVRSYSEKFFKNAINSIIDYNKKVWASFVKRDEVSYFEDYKDSLPFYQEIENPIAVIATYHSSHFKIAKELFRANPKGKVFIEKPPVVSFFDAIELINLRRKGFWFDVGYNRRYIDWNKYIKRILEKAENPKIITMSVKEIIIPQNHWYFWPNQGTRITGNLCHWIDLVYFWLKSRPIELSLLNSDDSINLSLLFEDGSLVSITASDIGNNLRGVQERVEIRMAEVTIFIDDYRKMVIYDNGKEIIKRKFLRDKGHDGMYKRFLNAIASNESPEYQDDDIFWVSYITDKASEMFLNNQRHSPVNPDEIEKKYFL